MADYNFLQKFIEDKNPTPSYVFDLDALAVHVNKIKELLAGKARVCYAMKANPFLTRPMMKHVDLFEVCSPGEFRICERVSVPMEKIVLSGVYKNPSDIRYVLETYGGKGVYTVESLEHLKHLQRIAGELGLTIDVLLRVTSGNQFGVDEEDIRKIISRRQEYTALHILGLQFYSGTQKKNLSQMERELQSLDAFLGDLKKDYGYQAEELEYGPGLFAPYFVKDKEESVEELLGGFGRLLDNLTFGGNVILEMGRYLTYMCGYYITSIVDMKVNHGQNYAIVDGGIHQLVYYGQSMAMKHPYCHVLPEKQEGEIMDWNLFGSLCTVNDILVKQMPVRNLTVGDVIVFENTGAYSTTEGIALFLSRDLPKILLRKEDGEIHVLRDSIDTDPLNTPNYHE